MPKISVLNLPFAAAPAAPRQPGQGHTHAGPVFAYILEGEIENQVEPDPPRIYKPGGFFYEIPGHVHRFMWNLSTTEPARAIVFQAGDPGGKTAPIIKLLLQEALVSTINQELSLSRLTIPAGAPAEAPPQANPGVVYLLDGKIEMTGASDVSKTYGSGDLFLLPPNRDRIRFRNPNSGEPAKLLLYLVSGKGGPRDVH
jgi:quercetin dioxygenase-like cupin family protein